MPNARDGSTASFQKLLVLGEPGAGKTAQLWTLPGRKFAYFFDPNARASVDGLDIDYEEFLPDVDTVDFTLKGFNKGSTSDKPRRKNIEPKTYTAWENDFNDRYDAGFFNNYDWLCFDSLTTMSRALMNRMLFLNGRYGDIEDRSDYRVVGNKLASIFVAIASLKINLYVTGHLTTYQDEKTQKIMTQIGIPGSSRDLLPKLFSNIWLLQAATDDKAGYTLLTRAEPRGFQAIRTTIPGLAPRVDITIPEKDWRNAGRYGIGKLLADAKPRVPHVQPLALQSGGPGATEPIKATPTGVVTQQPSVAQGAATVPAASTTAPMN